ncbi:MAG: winged helix-turn-helix domain-containing protein [Pseudanabaenaceae cyanobacterium]
MHTFKVGQNAKARSREKAELRKMLLEAKSTDYGIDRQIWTGKIILEIIQRKWGIGLKDSRIYAILKEMGLSHQKAHPDYLNASAAAQQQFVVGIKKLQGLKLGHEFGIYDRPSLYYPWAEHNSKPKIPSHEKA